MYKFAILAAVALHGCEQAKDKEAPNADKIVKKKALQPLGTTEDRGNVPPEPVTAQTATTVEAQRAGADKPTAPRASDRTASTRQRGAANGHLRSFAPPAYND